MENTRVAELFEELKKKNLVKTKKEFSSLIGIDERNLNKYLKGNINLTITSSNYDKIIALNVNLNWLLTGKGSMFLNEEPKSNDDELKKKEAEIERLQKELEELKKAVHNLEKDDEELIELTPKEIKALKKKVEKLEKLEPEYEELKKTVAELEKDNERLDAEILEKFQRLKNQLNAKGIKFEFT